MRRGLLGFVQAEVSKVTDNEINDGKFSGYDPTQSDNGGQIRQQVKYYIISQITDSLNTTLHCMSVLPYLLDLNLDEETSRSDVSTNLTDDLNHHGDIRREISEATRTENPQPYGVHRGDASTQHSPFVNGLRSNPAFNGTQGIYFQPIVTPSLKSVAKNILKLGM